ncbi:MAG: HlyD family efflux transporter periplasmic adaptor subunit [Chloroflexi bacterium]|nr:HlyD family efflux transporter periplasmic adaptor subunit [Chloroflexota bacterium]
MKTKQLIILFSLLMVLTACDQITTSSDEDGLEAAGVIEATEIMVAAELGGRVEEVFVATGDVVQVGDPLFRIEDTLLAAQRQQSVTTVEAAEAQLATAETAVLTTNSQMIAANAGVEAAHAAVETAHATVDAAQAGLETAVSGTEIAAVQAQLTLVAARLQEQPARVVAWDKELPSEFTTPPWYFQTGESFAAAETEVNTALEALEVEHLNFEAIMNDSRYDDLREAEVRLAEAEAAFLVATELRSHKIDQSNDEQIDDYVQEFFDAAEAELEAAQLDYDHQLSDQTATDILEARGRLAVATERYEIAMDQFNSLLIGEESLTVRAAELAQWQAETLIGQAEAQVAMAETAVIQAQIGVTIAEANVVQVEAAIVQAETAVTQAEKLVAQAQAALNLVDIQMERLVVETAVSGTILTRNIEPGELVQPGLTAMTIGQLDELTVTVYISENRYGQISLGDNADLTVDSFPNDTFEAEVIRIADRAEYTPRNVQTKEERQTTVYAIELSVTDSESRLKPGMPADVAFGN